MEIFECDPVKACKGGYDSECAIGYHGNKCANCEYSNDRIYTQNINNECVLCPKFDTELLRLLFLFVLFLCYILYVINSGLNDAYEHL